MIKLGQTINSLFYLRKTFRFIKTNRWCWKYLLIPIIINFTLLVILWVLMFNFIQGFLLGLGILSTIPGIITGVLSGIILIVTLLITIYLFFLLASIISSPFNGLITDKMLSNAGLKPAGEKSMLRKILTEISRTLKFESFKLFLIFLIFVLGFPLSAIPVVGVMIVGVFHFSGNTYLSLVDYFDPGLSYEGLSVFEKFKYVIKLISKSPGFFLISGLLMYIPLVNIIYIPIAVISANLILIDLEK